MNYSTGVVKPVFLVFHAQSPQELQKAPVLHDEIPTDWGEGGGRREGERGQECESERREGGREGERGERRRGDRGRGREGGGEGGGGGRERERERERGGGGGGRRGEGERERGGEGSERNIEESKRTQVNGYNSTSGMYIYNYVVNCIFLR